MTEQLEFKVKGEFKCPALVDGKYCWQMDKICPFYKVPIPECEDYLLMKAKQEEE